MSNETEQLDVVSPEVYRMMEYGSEERRNQEIASYESILRFIAALPSDKQALALTIGENLIGYQIYHGIDSDEVRSQIEQYGEDWSSRVMPEINLNPLSHLARAADEFNSNIGLHFGELWDATSNLGGSFFRDAIDPILGVGKDTFDFSAAEAYAIGFAYADAVQELETSAQSNFNAHSIGGFIQILGRFVYNGFSAQGWSWSAAKNELLSEHIEPGDLRATFSQNLTDMDFDADKIDSIMSLVLAEEADGQPFHNGIGTEPNGIPLYSSAASTSVYGYAANVVDPLLPDTTATEWQNLMQTAGDNPVTTALTVGVGAPVSAAAWHRLRPIANTYGTIRGTIDGLRGQYAPMSSPVPDNIMRRMPDGTVVEQRPNASLGREHPFMRHWAQTGARNLRAATANGVESVRNVFGLNGNSFAEAPLEPFDSENTARTSGADAERSARMSAASEQAANLRSQAASLPEGDPRRATLETLAERAEIEARRAPNANASNILDDVHSARALHPSNGSRANTRATGGRLAMLGVVAVTIGNLSSDIQLDDEERSECDDNEVCQSLATIGTPQDTNAPLSANGVRPNQNAGTMVPADPFGVSAR